LNGVPFDRLGGLAVMFTVKLGGTAAFVQSGGENCSLLTAMKLSEILVAVARHGVCH